MTSLLSPIIVERKAGKKQSQELTKSQNKNLSDVNLLKTKELNNETLDGQVTNPEKILTTATTDSLNNVEPTNLIHESKLLPNYSNLHHYNHLPPSNPLESVYPASLTPAEVTLTPVTASLTPLNTPLVSLNTSLAPHQGGVNGISVIQHAPPGATLTPAGVSLIPVNPYPGQGEPLGQVHGQQSSRYSQDYYLLPNPILSFADHHSRE